MLAKIDREVQLEVAGPVTLAATLDALEAHYPALRGAIRDQATGRRRSLIRFFAGKKDFSDIAPDAPLPAAVACGEEPLRVVGAIAGG
jgi:hypothetical protein